MRREKAKAHVVKEFQIGNTRIQIADNYCIKTEEEAEQLLQELSEQVQRYFIAAAAAGNYDYEREEA